MDKYELYSKQFRYIDIENSAWYKELTANSNYRERSRDSIKVEFRNKEDADNCVKNAKARNIRCGYILSRDCWGDCHTVHIDMDWQKDRPRMLSRKLPLILD